MRKIILLLSGVLMMCLISTAQQVPQKKRNLKEITEKFMAAYEKAEDENKVEKEEKDGDGLMQQFRRWEYLMKSRTYPSGNIPPMAIQWQEWQKYQRNHSDEFIEAGKPSWAPVGSATVPGNGGGQGRINVIRFDPNDYNIIYAGAAGGGVWKTTNGGSSWVCTTDEYPVTSIADIAIDKNNSNNIYAATGDGAGYEVGADFWGGVYSAGILRSTDGGSTWAHIGKETKQEDAEIIQRLLINPTKSEVLLKATRSGIYRSKDAGLTWKQVLSNHCYDMEWNTADANIVYAGGDGYIFKSTDMGKSFTQIYSGMGSGRVSLEVSAANADVIYALSGSYFRKSTNGGTTWSTKTYPSGASFYGYYDLALGCAQDNSEILMAGGLNAVKSVNGGTSWSATDNWSNHLAVNYVHADKHVITFFPNNSNRVLIGCDGGIFKTTNNGANWSDLSNGIQVAQIYRIGTSPQNINLVVSGWQDNGCNKWDGINWTQIYGADGMEAAIDPTNENTIYECYQYGALSRSYDGGSNWTYIAPTSGDWVTPFVIDPIENKRLYYGSTALYKTENKGNSWSSVSGVSFSNYIQAIAVAPSDNNIVYAASLDKIYRINIGANTSKIITTGLPVSSAGINYIAVSNTDPDNVWVVFAGYSDNNKVFRSTNGGNAWTNVSGSLPNMPVNTITYQNNSDDAVFIGTDVGIYSTSNANGGNTWRRYGKKLPNVMVHELEINYTSNKLVAATYGRGVWQVDLPALSARSNVSNPQKEILKASVFPNPVKDFLNISIANTHGETIAEIYKLTGEKVLTKTFDAALSKSIRVDVSNLPFGHYILRLQNGGATFSREIQVLK